MKPPQQHSRINLTELKAQIVRKLGPDGSKQYFYYLNRLLSLKISKVEFSKICLTIFGRENVPLHNQFIRSILKNACRAKVPPSSHRDEYLKPGAGFGGNEASNDQNGSHNSLKQSSNQLGLPNGNILPNGRTCFTFQQSTAIGSSDFDVTMEDAGLNPRDKLSLTKRPAEGPVSVHKKDQVRGDGRELHARSELQAPLGVPFYPVSVGGSHRVLPLTMSSSKRICSSNYGALLENITLRERMQQIAREQGLEGVAIDCANLLNSGLDSYLKGLMRSCVQLLGAKSGHEPAKKKQMCMKLVNGLRIGHQFQVSSNRSSEVMQEQAPNNLISLQDFRVAMELNPQQLGKDWPLLLEKVCARTSEQ